MSVLWQTPAVVLAVVAWLQAPPATLADAARREALRRQLVPESSITLTNLGLPAGPPPAAVTQPEPPPGDPQAAAPPAGAPPVAAPPATAAEPPPAPPTPPREEKWWRARMDAARSTLERNRFLADSIQSRINSLQADVVNIDDPAQQALRRQQLGQALTELERLKTQIVADEQAIEDIRTEARRNNIPPGWIR
jgi:hypothetical protein